MSAVDLFISYSNDDAAAARELRSLLESAGYSCWMAPDDVIGADPWAEQILEAIQGSRAMLVLVSSHSNGSRHVSREVHLATSRNGIVLPVRIEDVQLGTGLEYFLAGIQYIDLFPGPVSDHGDRLLRRVGSIVPIATLPGGAVAATVAPDTAVMPAFPVITAAPVIPAAPPAADTVVPPPAIAPAAVPSTPWPPAAVDRSAQSLPPQRSGFSAWARANSMLFGALATVGALVVIATGVLAFGRGSTSSPGPGGTLTVIVDPPSAFPSQAGSSEQPQVGPGDTGLTSTLAPASFDVPTATPEVSAPPTQPPRPSPTQDNKAPTGIGVTIKGSSLVTHKKVDLTFKATGATQMLLGRATSKTASCAWDASWINYRASLNNYDLKGGSAAGQRWICVKFRDAAKNVSSIARDGVTFDNPPVIRNGLYFNFSAATLSDKTSITLWFFDPAKGIPIATDADGATLRVTKLWLINANGTTQDVSSVLDSAGQKAVFGITQPYCGSEATFKYGYTVKDDYDVPKNGYLYLHVCY